jgi:hypothetical protein
MSFTGKITKGKVFKFHGQKVVISAISPDGTHATLNYATGSGKTGYAGTVVLGKNSPVEENKHYVQVVDESFGDDVVTLEQYYTPDSVDGSEPEEILNSYISSKKPLTEEQKEQFLNSPYAQVRRMMGSRNDITSEQCEALINDKDAWARGLVAYNPNLTEGQVRKLAKDSDENVRAAIAWRDDTPKDVLVDLSKDKSIEVRTRVARNSNTDEILQAALSNDRSSQVRLALVDNKELSSKVLDLLVNDKDKTVKANAELLKEYS